MAKTHSIPAGVKLPKSVAAIAESVLLGYHKVAQGRTDRKTGKARKMSASSPVTFSTARSGGAFGYLTTFCKAAGLDEPTIATVGDELGKLGYTVEQVVNSNGDSTGIRVKPSKGQNISPEDAMVAIFGSK